MKRKFFSQLGMAETKKQEAHLNAYMKRAGLKHHPVRGCWCNCPSPSCAGFLVINHQVDMRDITLYKDRTPPKRRKR